MLALIYNESLAQGTVPDDWRQANIAPVFKKGEKYNAAYYRPVSLTIIYLHVLTPEADIRQVPRNQVLGVSFFFVSFCAMLVVRERRASACLVKLSAKQGSHWYHF